MNRPGGKIVLLVLASAVVPGLGHVLLGWRARGAALFAVVLATALVGLSLGPRNPAAPIHASTTA